MKLLAGGVQLGVAILCIFYGTRTQTIVEPLTNYAPNELSLSSRLTVVQQVRGLPGSGAANFLGLGLIVGGGVTLFLWSREGEEVEAIASTPAPNPVRAVATPPPQPPAPEPDVWADAPTVAAAPPPPAPVREVAPPPPPPVVERVEVIEPKKSKPQDEGQMRRSQSPFIFELLQEPVVVIAGEKGSGKSSKQAWMAGEHLKSGHRVSICNPFAKAGEYQGIELHGRGTNYPDIEAAIFDFAAEAKRRVTQQGLVKGYRPQWDEQHWHMAFDEFSGYANNIGSEFLQELYEVCFQHLRQANMSVSIVAHGFQQQMLGGAAAFQGTFTSFHASCVKLFCESKPHPTLANERICAGFAKLVKTDMATGSDRVQRIPIPSWMQGPRHNNFSSLAPKEVRDEIQEGLDLFREFQQYRDRGD